MAPGALNRTSDLTSGGVDRHEGTSYPRGLPRRRSVQPMAR